MRSTGPATMEGGCSPAATRHDSVPGPISKVLLAPLLWSQDSCSMALATLSTPCGALWKYSEASEPVPLEKLQKHQLNDRINEWTNKTNKLVLPPLIRRRSTGNSSHPRDITVLLRASLFTLLLGVYYLKAYLKAVFFCFVFSEFWKLGIYRPPVSTESNTDFSILGQCLSYSPLSSF